MWYEKTGFVIPSLLLLSFIRNERENLNEKMKFWLVLKLELFKNVNVTKARLFEVWWTQHSTELVNSF